MTKRLLFLNGFAALTVVLYHATAWGFTAMFWWVDRYRAVAPPDFDAKYSLPYFGLRFIEQLIIFGIPAFLVISGYFISISTGRNQRTVKWDVVFSRIRGLIIPFMVWSLIIMSLGIVQGTRYTPLEFVTTLVTGQAAPPLYYVPMLIQLYLLSPLLVPLARAHWKALLLITGALQIFVLVLNYTLVLRIDVSFLNPLPRLAISWLFTSHLFWFCLGMAIGFHIAEFKQFLHQYRWYFLAAAAILLVLGMVEWELLLVESGEVWVGPRTTLIDHFYSLGIIFTFLAFDGFTPPFPGQLSWLGSKSYGIYLVHTPVLEYASRAIYHILPWMLGYQSLFVGTIILLGLAIPLILMEAVNRLPARRIYAYLFG